MTRGKIGLVVLGVATVVGWAPLVGVLVSTAVASAFGCALNEGNTHPCVIAGIDWGETLYTLFVAGWLMLVTWPLILLTLALWIVLGIVYVMRRRQARQVTA